MAGFYDNDDHEKWLDYMADARYDMLEDHRIAKEEALHERGDCEGVPHCNICVDNEAAEHEDGTCGGVEKCSICEKGEPK
jgi:hypothetical protein